MILLSPKTTRSVYSITFVMLRWRRTVLAEFEVLRLVPDLLYGFPRVVEALRVPSVAPQLFGLG